MRTLTQDPPALKWTLVGTALAFLLVFLVLPLAAVFHGALAKGLWPYLRALVEAESLAALRLTLVSALAALFLNMIFGIAAAWSLARFRFPGRTLLLSLLDLPFSISPVISGMLLVLLFGAGSGLGRWLMDHGLKILFAPPGVVLATVFVTFPFVARELIPLMESQGREEEEAALILGAGGWQMFFRISLPKMKWGLLYGLILCNARAMGEFGAVSVVSGHIRGMTNTIPLQVEVLYNDYQFAAAFSLASLLAFLSLGTLAAKAWVERHFTHEKEGKV